jgi:hypothetical protein
MDVLLAGLTGVCAMVYIDDIIVYSETLEQHMKDLDAVLGRIEEANLKVKISKCHLCKQELPYLGYIVTDKGVKVDPAAIEVIKNEPAPHDVSGVRRLLGMATFYRRFVKEFAALCEPLTRLLKKDVPWEWGHEQQKAHSELIEHLTSARFLLTQTSASRSFCPRTPPSTQSVEFWLR